MPPGYGRRDAAARNKIGRGSELGREQDDVRELVATDLYRKRVLSDSSKDKETPLSCVTCGDYHDPDPVAEHAHAVRHVGIDHLQASGSG